MEAVQRLARFADIQLDVALGEGWRSEGCGKGECDQGFCH
jgi:hypothetical protein